MTEISTLPLVELVAPSRRTMLHRRLRGHKGLVISAVLLTLIVLVALLAPALAPYDPYAQDLGRRIIPPVWYQKGTWAHVLGLLKWDRFAVVMRAATQQVRGLEYVAAAECVGASTLRIVLGEILPNVLPHLIVVATIEAASAILLEAALSFLGLGVQPPLPSWGLMIAEAKVYMFFSFWLIAIPGTALAILVLAINMLGDAIRDVAAPGGRG